MNRLPAVAIGLLTIVVAVRAQGANVRIQDITTIEGQRVNVITGIGLVTGLNGTGGKTPMTREFLANFTLRFGNRFDPVTRPLIRLDNQQKTDNVSMVAVSAEIPVTARPGQRIDATVSALDDASSLLGGELQFTALRGVDGHVYATAAGRTSIGGGFSFGGDAAAAQKNHPTVARVPNMAIVEKSVPFEHFDPTYIRILLNDPNWDTARQITDAINQLSPTTAHTESYGSVYVKTPTGPDERANFIARLGNLEVQPNTLARVVINERSGTVIIGKDVKLAHVAIAHGAISVVRTETPQVSQPEPFSDGATVVVPRTELDVIEESSRVNEFPEAATVGDLADGLSMLGVTPGDLSAIFQELKAGGFLHAHLEFH